MGQRSGRSRGVIYLDTISKWTSRQRKKLRTDLQELPIDTDSRYQCPKSPLELSNLLYRGFILLQRRRSCLAVEELLDAEEP